MAKDFEEVQEEILEMLKASDIPTVFETAIPAGYTLPTQHDYYLPYALVMFGGKSPVAQRNQALGSSRDDLKWTSVAVECVGSSQHDARMVSKIVRNLLEGYIPDPSWGELTEQLSGDYAVKVPQGDIMPVRYATGIVFNGLTNAVT